MDSILSVLIGGVGVAFISGIFMLLQSRMTVKAEERSDIRKMTHLLEVESKEFFETVQTSIRVLLHDRIKHLAREHIDKGYIYYDDLHDIITMYDIYHDKLKGNGTLAKMMKEVMELTVKSK